jgi:hypothetical protein
VRERDSHRLARFPTRFAGEAHCDEGRRGSGELWTTATLRRDAEGDGELECVIYFLDCFQTRRRAAAGELRAAVLLRLRMSTLNSCRIKVEEGSGRCAGTGEGG